MRSCNFDRCELIPGLWQILYKSCGSAFVFADLIPGEWEGWRINEV